MKKTFSIVMILVIACLMFVGLSGCGSSVSKGLEFESNGDGTCVWIGIGSCTDTEIVVPTKNGEEMVVAVGTAVLDRNAGVTKVTLPDSVRELEKEAFAYNNDLTEIDFGEGLEIIGDTALYACEKLEKVELPGAVRNIGSLAFGECKLISEIVIPEGVSEIGYGAFESLDSNLKKIVLPSTLKEFSESVFSLEALEEIELNCEYKYCHLLQNEDDSTERKLDFYGYLNNESETGLEIELTDENLGQWLCLMANKDELKINGKTVSAPIEFDVGKYEAANTKMKDFSFEITSEEELVFYLGDTEALINKYSINEKTNEAVVDAEFVYNGIECSLEATLIPLKKEIYVAGTLDVLDTEEALRQLLTAEEWAELMAQGGITEEEVGWLKETITGIWELK